MYSPAAASPRRKRYNRGVHGIHNILLRSILYTNNKREREREREGERERERENTLVSGRCLNRVTDEGGEYK
jgi:hypothetical protein